MNKKSVVYRLIFMFTSITALVLIFVGLTVSVLFNDSYTKEKRILFDKQIKVMEDAFINYRDNGTEEFYIQVNYMMNSIKSTMEMDVMITDQRGYVNIVSDPTYEELKYKQLILTDKVKEELTEEGFVFTDRLEIDGVNKECYIKAVKYNDKFLGSIVLLGNKHNERVPIRTYLIIWIAIALALVLSSIIVYIFAQKVIIRPLDEINNAARKLARGEVERRVIITSKDEIGQLAESFNIMATSLEAVDRTRKEFISNLSHELRSPITSIKGFITGIIDGIIPKDKENYYLGIVYDEIDRLARLVNDLLDISSLESGKFNLKIREIDINEVISLCVVNLESKIKDKGLRVDVVYEEEHQYVLGDRDRLIQVITNIVENAIKYGFDNGEIKIKTYTRMNKAYVSIFNSGDEIPIDNLNNIWDRFYKMDKSRTNKISTGLGLPIVRLILTQHKEDIWVKNIKGKGVEFTFSLTKTK